MTTAIIFSILASLVWAVTNHIDKFMVSGIDDSKDNIKVLIVFSTFVAGIVLTPLWLVFSHFAIDIKIISLIWVFLSAVVYLIATVLYFKAIEENDTSIIVIMFQMIPVFSYLLAFIIFKENLTMRQIIGSIIIILSAVIISFDLKEHSNNKKTKALILMILSSFLYAVYYVLFDAAIRHSEYYPCTFWLQISLLVIGLSLLLLKRYRNPFVLAIKKNGKRYLSLNVTNEILNLIAHLLVHFANLTLPIALVNVLNDFQGAFVFILGIIGTIVFPKYIKEDLEKSVVIQKVISIALGIIGLIILVYK